MTKQRFEPYTAYKDSGVEWLGEIPVHWTCLSLARVTLSFTIAWLSHQLATEDLDDAER